MKQEDSGEREIKAGWTTWNVAKVVAQTREARVHNVTALCAFWRGKPQG